MVNAVLTDCGRATPPRRRAPAPLLDGIRRADWTGRPKAARRLGAVLADRGEVAYCVATPDAPLSADQPANARAFNFMQSAAAIRDRVLNGLSPVLRRELRLLWGFAVHRAKTGAGGWASAVGRTGVPMRPPA